VRKIAALAVVIGFTVLPAWVQAQEAYPTKPIKIIVPTAAGGASDITARIIGDKIEKSLGQPIIVEPRPGANGNIGAEAVLKLPADGYTLMMGHIGVMSINSHLYKGVSFDPLKDFEPVAMTVSYSNLLVVHPGLPATSVKELIAYGKANPGKLKYGSPGFGGSLHMGMEMFKLMAGVDIEHVPYRGASPALIDLMGGHIQLAFSDPLATLSQVRAGNVRALAVSGARHSSVAPDIPTVAESGLPGYDVQGWVGVVTRAGTPKDRIAKLNEHINRAIAMADVTQKFIEGGADIRTGSPEDFGKFIRAEYERWGEVVRKANLKID
jgi:tripartite-type tricarboxylate transporter receptor subunit TctC